MRIVSIPSLHVIPVGDLSAARPFLEHADQLGHAVPRLRVGELAAVRRHDHVRELVEGAADARRPAALVAEPLALEHLRGRAEAAPREECVPRVRGRRAGVGCCCTG